MMKVGELIRKLELFDEESDVFFEEAGHNRGGESEKFSLGFKEIYGFDEEVTIVLWEN